MRLRTSEAPIPCPSPQRGPYDASADIPGTPFDRGQAFDVMNSVNPNACAQADEQGEAWVQVRFETHGHVSEATACETTLPASVRHSIEARFRALVVAPFGGQGVTARKRVRIGSTR
jgi:hypothetical protein